MNSVGRLGADLLRAPMVTFTYFTPTDEFRTSQTGHPRPSSAILRNGAFENGVLLETKEKGVIYPIVHVAPFYGWHGLQEDLLPKGLQSYSNTYMMEQGLYTVLASVQADLFGSSYDDLLANSRLPRTLSDWSTFYVVLGFKQLPTSPFKDVMESHWKDWTGARYLYLNLPDDFGLMRLTLYRRYRPPANGGHGESKTSATDMDLFLYVLLAECVHVTARNRIFIKDFVQRMRADRMPPYVALYEDVQVADANKSPFLGTAFTRRRRSLSGGSLSSSPASSPFGIEDRSVTATSPIFGSPLPTFRSTFTFSTL